MTSRVAYIFEELLGIPGTKQWNIFKSNFSPNNRAIFPFGFPLIIAKTLDSFSCTNLLASNWYWGLRMTNNLGRMWMKTLFTQGAIRWVCGDRKWTLSTTTVTHMLESKRKIMSKAWTQALTTDKSAKPAFDRNDKSISHVRNVTRLRKRSCFDLLRTSRYRRKALANGNWARECLPCIEKPVSKLPDE